MEAPRGGELEAAWTLCAGHSQASVACEFTELLHLHPSAFDLQRSMRSVEHTQSLLICISWPTIRRSPGPFALCLCLSACSSARRDDTAAATAVGDIEAPRAHSKRKQQRTRTKGELQLYDNDEDEEESHGEESRALLLHRCVYLSCPLACSCLLLLFLLRILWVTFFPAVATAAVAPDAAPL